MALARSRKCVACPDTVESVQLDGVAEMGNWNKPRKILPKKCRRKNVPNWCTVRPKHKSLTTKECWTYPDLIVTLAAVFVVFLHCTPIRCFEILWFKFRHFYYMFYTAEPGKKILQKMLQSCFLFTMNVRIILHIKCIRRNQL